MPDGGECAGHEVTFWSRGQSPQGKGEGNADPKLRPRPKTSNKLQLRKK